MDKIDKRTIPLIDLIPICWDELLKELQAFRKEQTVYFAVHERTHEKIDEELAKLSSCW